MNEGWTWRLMSAAEKKVSSSTVVEDLYTNFAFGAKRSIPQGSNGSCRSRRLVAWVGFDYLSVSSHLSSYRRLVCSSPRKPSLPEPHGQHYKPSTATSDRAWNHTRHRQNLVSGQAVDHTASHGNIRLRNMTKRSRTWSLPISWISRLGELMSSRQSHSRKIIWGFSLARDEARYGFKLLPRRLWNLHGPQVDEPGRETRRRTWGKMGWLRSLQELQTTLPYLTYPEKLGDYRLRVLTCDWMKRWRWAGARKIGQICFDLKALVMCDLHYVVCLITYHYCTKKGDQRWIEYKLYVSL